MTRLVFLASAAALAAGITAASFTGQPLLGLPFVFAAAFFADLYQRRRQTGRALRKLRAALPSAAAPEFTPCCQFWSSSAGQVHSRRCRTRRT